MMTSSQLATPLLFPAAENTNFQRILLAIDFGAASLAAARWSTTHVSPGADAVLMHVMPDADELPHSADDESVRRMAPAVVGGLGGFAAMLPVGSSRSVVRVGRPSSVLATVATETDASLLVLGRRADANRVRVGEPNVIERTARRSSASVLVVPEGTTQAPDHIVAAVDHSRFAPRVLEVARRLARMHEVPLTVLHVLSPVAGTYERIMRTGKHLLSYASGRNLKAARTAVPRSLAQATARWLAQLVNAHNVAGRDSTEVATGDPAREIARMAMRHDSALVVVGLRGADEAPVGSVGSVARELLTRGPIPMLAVSAAGSLSG